jgi:phosphonopyruvate decarboxylase
VISCEIFMNYLLDHKISFFTGVPDSLLKDLCSFISDHVVSNNHVIAANEGNAIGLAAGHYLATGNPAVVYLQNSGLGNTVNPLVSLADPEVYSIPILLLIGWRGEPGKKDEPQHLSQGKVTIPILQALGLHHDILPDDQEQASKCLDKAVNCMRSELRPFALVVRKDTFTPYKSPQPNLKTHYDMTREEAIKILSDWIHSDGVVFSTTGKASRELFEHRVATGHHDRGQDFMVVGSMGHTSQIAMGVALANPDRDVFCLDGDGSMIMHMGSLAIIGAHSISNFVHIILNNHAYDSVGGQPTASSNIDIPAIAKSCGYKQVLRAQSKLQLDKQLKNINLRQGPVLLEILVRQGARNDLGRPTTTPIENKEKFMQFLQSAASQ